jgi:three-Cys-motif partner protein
MKAQRFGSAHTEKKLRLVANYLDRFVTALKNQPFQTLYVDAFAGTGAWSRTSAAHSEGLGLIEADLIAKGSARRALEVNPPFDRYVYIEKSRRKSSALEELHNEFPGLANRIEIVTGDANEALQALCSQEDWRRTRAVVFLDPFGLQVDWATVEALGRTKAVDLWYLVPTGIGINRQVTTDGRILVEGGKRIDAMLGTDAWRSRMVKTERTPVDLFGKSEARTIKAGGVDEITAFFIERLATVFKGGVVKYGLPLGHQGRPFYTLVFACANSTKAASALALRLATAVLKG